MIADPASEFERGNPGTGRRPWCKSRRWSASNSHRHVGDDVAKHSSDQVAKRNAGYSPRHAKPKTEKPAAK